MTPEEVVQKQLDYYNNHDVDGFLSTYSDDIKIYDLENPVPRLTGKEDMRIRYTERFKLSGLKAEIAKRIIQGNFVIDHEHVSGIKENEISKVAAIYEVKEDLIINVWFIR